MIRTFSLPFCATALVALPLHAQSLERRIQQATHGADARAIEFSFAARPNACGDGLHFLSDGLGGGGRIYFDGNDNGWRGGEDRDRCLPGPARVVLGTSDGQIVRLRTYVGPRQAADNEDHTDLGMASVADAVDFLSTLVQQDRGGVSSDAILPIVLADSIDPWPMLLRFARNDRTSPSIRSTASFWLARGAGYVLGVNGRHENEDDDVRAQAVFALSQQPRESSVPRLIEIVNTSTRPVVRAQALFWLGQSGDPRAIALFEDILRRR